MAIRHGVERTRWFVAVAVCMGFAACHERPAVVPAPSPQPAPAVVSDGNFSAALGVPTLDGLGALGDGPHAIHEHVTIKDLASRTALAAGLIARLGDT